MQSPSDGGLLLLREVDKKLGLTKQFVKVIKDERHQAYVDHSIEQLLKQRVYAIAAGYEDVTDHDTLNKDACFQTIGAIVLTNSRRIQFLLSSYYPEQQLFSNVTRQLVPT